MRRRAGLENTPKHGPRYRRASASTSEAFKREGMVLRRKLNAMVRFMSKVPVGESTAGLHIVARRMNRFRALRRSRSVIVNNNVRSARQASPPEITRRGSAVISHIARLSVHIYRFPSCMLTVHVHWHAGVSGAYAIAIQDVNNTAREGIYACNMPYIDFSCQ